MNDSNSLREFIIRWNNALPFDLYYRRKYKIPFLSKKHKKVDFIIEIVDYLEDKLINRYLSNKKEGLNEDDEAYSSDEIKLSKEEIDDEFDNLDLGDYESN